MYKQCINSFKHENKTAGNTKVVSALKACQLRFKISACYMHITHSFQLSEQSA